MKNNLANWPAPKNITALSTTRLFGYSQAPYDSNNMGLHVGDNEHHVLQNRQQLRELLNLPGEPQWLTQTHSTHCVIVEEDPDRNADAAISRSKNHPLVILTADCLPIMLCNVQGTEVAAVHAGWKGLAHGIIENTLEKMESSPTDVLAWIGPSICQNCYEVGEEVYQTFTHTYPLSKQGFKPVNGKWLANLPLIAEIILAAKGIKGVYQSGLCTFELKNELYSYRRTAQTGRIATLIWFNDQPQD
ncbi:peptidoglycan editing factor PgeF [Fluoribacter dumoffii]|uniref:Purine nucleoside phosphorylase n=1 Tax=Fluoribacter dumoffii TaxID=463 RepID=A0A377G8M4_9GAMM|nr:peptidoglycan editing factor PgeF [Fluoribacter dumoffii]KTC90038.1 Laccase domain protein YfiH [Fluoribacter dumoffii NY 23]MCW8385337.1 peptidoglycan editing factor PgeF [Fluoribacter dumoffii]MCW8418390.1 peptidoglycan editing factor PgeF [Fluoribacter dumoffii]MCW8453768.1 peptidoglycan editing factor PgeF [Fluoribacter dumoffii]MCW8462161.1 peptidoglycan editing factor PgeF [Fluoribacter dumoffii]